MINDRIHTHAFDAPHSELLADQRRNLLMYRETVHRPTWLAGLAADAVAAEPAAASAA